MLPDADRMLTSLPGGLQLPETAGGRGWAKKRPNVLLFHTQTLPFD